MTTRRLERSLPSWLVRRLGAAAIVNRDQPRRGGSGAEDALEVEAAAGADGRLGIDLTVCAHLAEGHPGAFA